MPQQLDPGCILNGRSGQMLSSWRLLLALACCILMHGHVTATNGTFRQDKARTAICGGAPVRLVSSRRTAGGAAVVAAGLVAV